MKNIHILPTSQPSRLLISKINNLQFLKDNSSLNPNNHFKGTYKNIYITNDEEIKKGDWFITTDTNEIHKSDWIKFHFNNGKKIILTTDQDLIDVQTIDDEFLEWFVKNPSCEEVEVKLIKDSEDHPELEGGYREEWEYYDIIIPKEEPKQETTLEEASAKYAEIYRCPATNDNEYCRHDIISAINFGAKLQQEQIGKSEFLQRLRATKYDAEARRLIFETFKNK